ncbi:MAG: phytanoyl-CoA dioxygenase family protein [Verrucomicrobiota bacterium]
MSTLASHSPLCSLGEELDTGAQSFGFIRDSNDLLSQPAALRDRLDEDGYLYIRNFFDPALILAGRRSIFERVAREGQLHPDHDLMEGFVHPDMMDAFKLDTAPTFKGTDGKKQNPDKAAAFRPELAASSPEIRRVVFGPEICEFYANLFGEPVRHFDYIWCRLMGPGHGTPVHCDKVYMGRGSQDLLTCWIPYVDIPLELGGLILLENSHKQSDRISDYLDKDVDAYCENDPDQVQAVAKDGKWSFPGWLSKSPDTLPKKFGGRWLTAPEWKIGDFITFRINLIHGSLDNSSDRIRFSTDTRFQPAAQPADERWIGENPPGHSLAGKLGRIC